jgi:hypothetical protein
VPRSIARRCCIERGNGTSTRGDAPRGERPGKSRPPMAGKEEARRSRGLRGNAKPAGGKLSQAFRLSECCDKGQALKPLFKRPGRVLHRPCLNDEETRGVETKSKETWPVRAPPFLCGVLSETPQQEFLVPAPRRALSDHGKGKTERGRGIAVKGRFDLMQSCLGESV